MIRCHKPSEGRNAKFSTFQCNNWKHKIDPNCRVEAIPKRHRRMCTAYINTPPPPPHHPCPAIRGEIHSRKGPLDKNSSRDISSIRSWSSYIGAGGTAETMVKIVSIWGLTWCQTQCVQHSEHWWSYLHPRTLGGTWDYSPHSSMFHR